MPGDDDAENDVNERLLDVIYTGVGLGILAINKAQVARRNAMADGGVLEGTSLGASLDELQRIVDDPDTVTAVVSWLQREVRSLDDRLDGFEDRLDEALSRLEPDLPETAQQFVHGLRALARDQAGTLRSALGLDS